MRSKNICQGAPAPRSQRPHLVAGIAETPAEVHAALALRFRVFGEEMRATMPEAHLGVDRDPFDAYCEHLVVRDPDAGRVVGTYRILDARGAEQTGGFYAETEFDLGRVREEAGRLVEVGRACIDPAYRTGATIATLLTALATYVVSRGYEYVMGCASIHIGDDPSGAAALCRRLVDEHPADARWRVVPRRPFVVHAIAPREDVQPPPLLRAYLRMGAHVCGEAAWDPDFDTADLFLLLPVGELTSRYAKRFLRAA
jgi:putative hemolysin